MQRRLKPQALSDQAQSPALRLQRDRTTDSSCSARAALPVRSLPCPPSRASIASCRRSRIADISAAPAALQPLLGNLRGFANANNPRQIFRSSAALALMAAAINLRLDQRSLLDVKRAGALRRMDLVAGNRKRIARNFLYVDRHFACGLDCVGMKKTSASCAILPISSTG